MIIQTITKIWREVNTIKRLVVNVSSHNSSSIEIIYIFYTKTRILLLRVYLHVNYTIFKHFFLKY